MCCYSFFPFRYIAFIVLYKTDKQNKCLNCRANVTSSNSSIASPIADIDRSWDLTRKRFTQTKTEEKEKILVSIHLLDLSGLSGLGHYHRALWQDPVGLRTEILIDRNLLQQFLVSPKVCCTLYAYFVLLSAKHIRKQKMKNSNISTIVTTAYRSARVTAARWGSGCRWHVRW